MKWNEFKLVKGSAVNNLRERDELIHPSDLSPYEVYRVLKEKFGDLNANEDEEKIQWEVVLETSEAYFEIYDWKIATLSIGVYLKEGVTIDAKHLGEQFYKVISNQVSQSKSNCKKRIENPDGFLLENPFVTSKNTADSIDQLIKQSQKTIHKNEGISFFCENESELVRSAFLLYLSSMEGFINLIYELYLRKELRMKRIYERVSREQIDLKILLAPIYCECFEEATLDSNHDSFRNYHSLINLRNDFVHANLTKSMKNPIIYEDGFSFLINVDSTTSINVPNNFRDLKSEHLDETRRIIDNLIDYILSSMQKRFRREFEKIMLEEFIHTDWENNQLFL